MGTNDLPPVGTLWGDIPPEVRERLPVGTVLGPAPGAITRPASALVTRVEGEGWRNVHGMLVEDFSLNDRRPILSYPTDAGTPKPADTPKEPAMNDDKIPPRPWTAPGTTSIRAADGRHIASICGADTVYDEDVAIAAYIVKAVNSLESRDIVEQDRWQAHRERDEAIKERDEARAEADRLKASASVLSEDYGHIEWDGDEEPDRVKPPRGWEWAGRWRPCGYATDEDNAPSVRWRRGVRRVAQTEKTNNKETT